MEQEDRSTTYAIHNEVAISALYQRHAPTIFAYLRLHTSSREDAEDLLLETFLQALEREDFPHWPETRQAAWLQTVARNKVVDRYRSASRRQFITIDQVADQLFTDDTLAPEQLALQREEYAQLLSTVRTLPALQQEVLRLRFTNGLKCAEIASLLDKRESSVRSLLSRTLSHLRSIYQKREE